MVRRSSFVLLLIGAGALLIGPAPSPRAQGAAVGDPTRMLDGDFAAVAVVQNERDHSLFDDVEVEVGFGHRTGFDLVSWYAGCNHYGGRGRITRTRVLVHSISSTDIDCAPQASHRDRWLTRFFASDPRWRLTESGLLKLSSEARRIRLVERAQDAGS